MMSDYVRGIKTVEYVQVPRLKEPQEMATTDIKSILLQDFGLVLDLQLEGESMDGSFSFRDFLISIKSKKMVIQNVQLLPYTQVRGKADIKQFVNITENLFGGKEKVPKEVAGWLASMLKGFDGSVLRNHINMQHPHSTYGEFMTMYHCVLECKAAYDRTNFKTFLWAMSSYDRWASRTFQWDVLKESLEDKKKKVEEKKDEMKKKKKVEEKKKGMKEDDDEAEEVYKGDIQELLKFISDTWEHPAQLYKNHLLTVLMLERRDLLSDLQQALHDIGCLPQLSH